MSTDIVAFSYTGLAPAIRQGVQERTAAIQERFARQTADVLASGRDLIEIKAQLDHGQWLGWLATEFPSTPRTAQRWMQAAEWAEGKNDTVCRLSPTDIYLLSSPRTPPEITAEVVADLEAGKTVDIDAIKEKIADAKHQEHAANVEHIPAGKRAAARQAREVRRAVDVGGAVLAHAAEKMAEKFERWPLSVEQAETMDALLRDVFRNLRRLRQRVRAAKLAHSATEKPRLSSPITIDSDCIDVTQDDADVDLFA